MLPSFFLCITLVATPTFHVHTIDDAFEKGYQVKTADIDRDGRPDVIALSTSPSQLVWYRNPDWQRFPISTVTKRNIDAAPRDIDGDGDMDLALASEFDLGDSTTGGLVQWLECPDDPTTEIEWAVHPIDAIPTAHRLRWADLEGDGTPELVNLPIIGVGATAPLYNVPLRFKAYGVPANTTTDAWAQRVIDDTLELAHGFSVVQWDDDSPEEILTASFQGVTLFDPMNEGFIKIPVGEGHAGTRPRIGSSEVALGRFAGGAPFVASIEPWHGNEVVVYSPPVDVGPWNRAVIDDSLTDGHALAVVDFNNDGTSEIVAGGRGAPHSVFLYVFEKGHWVRATLHDGAVGAAGFEVCDLDGDGDMDLVAIGTPTDNVVWYECR